MLFKHKIEQTDNLMAENRLLKFCLIVVAASVVWGAYFVSNKVTNQKVVIQYPDGSTLIAVQGETADQEYIERFTRYVTSLAFNYTPFNYDGQAKRLLQVTTSRYFPSLQNRLLEIKNTVNEFNVTSAYYIRNIQIDANKKTIMVEGLMFQSAHGSNMLGDRGEKKEYQIKYEIGNGGLLLDDLSERV